MPHRGRYSFALALAALLCACADRSAGQDPGPLAPSVLPAEGAGAVVPAADEKPADRLTDLMKRVSDLEGEAKKSKAKADAAAKKPTVNWTAQIQVDAIQSDQDGANRKVVGPIPDGLAFRRARFGMYGDYGPFEYRLAMDFALPGRPSFIDNFIGMNDVPFLGHVRAGHFFEPFSLEQYSQNRFVTFLERSLPTEPIAPGRNTGVMAFDTFADQRGTWAVGVFRTDSDVFGDDAGTDFRNAITGRATWLAWYDETPTGADLLHLGAAYSARATKGGQVRFQVRPEIRLGGAAAPNVPNFADSGPIGSSFYQLVGTELMWVRGPLSAQAEYVLVPVDTYASGAVYFQSWYVLGTYFLTGESRQYRRSTGTLERLTPRRDFVRRDGGCLLWGPGAIELALRLSHLDLNSGGIRGGRVTDLTAGVNWYLNAYLRLTANYIHAQQTPPKTGPSGAANFYGVRVNYDF